ncbi:MAG: stage II sporulation protein M [Candidatus Nanopelagicales bacterium]
MDVDAFVTVHRPEWDRLQRLATKRRLTGEEVNELVDLYQRVGTQLSQVRTEAPDPGVVAHLTQLVAQGRARVTGSSAPAWSEFLTFFRAGFPAAVWRARWWCIGAGVGFYLVAFVVGAWVAANPRLQAAIATPAEIKQLVEHDFADYYSADAAGAFAAQVWTNNAWISALVLVSGALFCLPAIYVLFQNALNVGVMGGLMVSHGAGGVFFGLITPHGLLELTAVFVAAGAGMRLGWQWISPGPRTRAVALAQEGRAAITIALGLVVVLLVSGAIEGFVTPSGLHTWARIVIGVLAFAGFIAYVWIFGSRAERAGYTGDLTAEGARTELAPTRG